jgi:hypothetical protein
MLRQRAILELQALALDLFRHDVDPVDIFEALHARSGLLVDAYGISVIPVTSFIQALPGLSSWDAERALCKYVARVVGQRRQQIDAFYAWALPQLHLPIVQQIIDAIVEIAQRNQEEPCAR